MQLSINLATRTYINHRRIIQILVILMASALVLLALGLFRIFVNSAELRGLMAESAVLQGKVVDLKDVPEKEYARLKTNVSFYNDIITRKTFDWLGMFARIEEATPPGVSLLSLSQEKSGTTRNMIKIEGVTTSFAKVRAYLERLEDSKAFSDILLLSHLEVVVSETKKGIQFTLSCKPVLP